MRVRSAKVALRSVLILLRASSLALLLALFVALFVALIVASAPAQAAPPTVVDLPETPAQLVLEAGWAPVEPTPALETSGLGAEQLGPARIVTILRRRAAGSRRRAPAAETSLVVLRFDSPNPAAWRKSTRAGYFNQVEEGLGLACPQKGSSPVTCRGLRRQKRQAMEAAGVPALELAARDRAGRTLLLRFLFFRTYTLLAAVELAPRSKELVPARKALASFAPPATWQR